MWYEDLLISGKYNPPKAHHLSPSQWQLVVQRTRATTTAYAPVCVGGAEMSHHEPVCWLVTVKPGGTLSLQMHHHRAEHWIVVSGTAKVTRGDEVILLTENQSTYIPLGEVHRLANPGKVPLEIIEVQSGSYLGEDDIVRFEDTYGR
jgi:mannose-6-phosphate isomerase-like protein (cupin superfamily)